jgi:hypothetical protein
MEFKTARLDKLARILTISVTVLLVGLSVFFVIKVPYGWLFAILMLSIILISYLLSPARYVIEGGKLVITKVIGKKVIIPLEQVTGYTTVPDFTKLRVARTFGNGGLFGYYGTFSTAEYGALNCQLTSLKQVFIIKTAHGQFAISPADRARFQEFFTSTVQGLTTKITQLTPVKPSTMDQANPLILLLPATIFLLTMIMVLSLYPQLPDRIAVHFDMQGNPDGWASRTSFIASGLIPAAVLCVISVAVFFLMRRSTRKPTLPYMVVALFAVFQLFTAFISLDTYWINTQDTHLIPFPYNIIGYVVIIVVLLFVYYRKTRTTA